MVYCLHLGLDLAEDLSERSGVYVWRWNWQCFCGVLLFLFYQIYFADNCLRTLTINMLCVLFDIFNPRIIDSHAFKEPPPVVKFPNLLLLGCNSYSVVLASDGFINCNQQNMSGGRVFFFNYLESDWEGVSEMRRWFLCLTNGNLVIGYPK